MTIFFDPGSPAPNDALNRVDTAAQFLSTLAIAITGFVVFLATKVAREQRKGLLSQSVRKFNSENRRLDRVRVVSKQRVGIVPILLSVLSLIVVLILGLLIYRHWSIVASNPERLLWVGLYVCLMFLGILAEIIQSFSKKLKSISDIKPIQVIPALILSIAVFYGLWSHVAQNPDRLYACYTSLMSGYAWRRVASTVTPGDDE